MWLKLFRLLKLVPRFLLALPEIILLVKLVLRLLGLTQERKGDKKRVKNLNLAISSALDFGDTGKLELLFDPSKRFYCVNCGRDALSPHRGDPANRKLPSDPS